MEMLHGLEHLQTKAYDYMRRETTVAVLQKELPQVTVALKGIHKHRGCSVPRGCQQRLYVVMSLLGRRLTLSLSCIPVCNTPLEGLPILAKQCLP